jgi:hypothetical protein
MKRSMATSALHIAVLQRRSWQKSATTDSTNNNSNNISNMSKGYDPGRQT